MKIHRNTSRLHDEAPRTAGREGRPCWLNTLVSFLQRGERLLTIRQKQTLLLCFTLIIGTCFLHLAITGVISPRNDHRPLARPLQGPLPQSLSPDSIQNKNLLP